MESVQNECVTVLLGACRWQVWQGSHCRLERPSTAPRCSRCSCPRPPRSIGPARLCPPPSLGAPHCCSSTADCAVDPALAVPLNLSCPTAQGPAGVAGKTAAFSQYPRKVRDRVHGSPRHWCTAISTSSLACVCCRCGRPRRRRGRATRSSTRTGAPSRTWATVCGSTAGG